MAINESLVLDGLQLNDVAGDYVLIDGTLAMDPPAQRPEWAQQADADGAELVRDPLRDNRTVSFDLRVNRIRIDPAASMDAVLGLIGAVSDKLQEAAKHADGVPLVWTAATGTISVTFDVLAGAVTAVPITVTGDTKGWFRKYPRFHVELTCRTGFRYPEIAGFTDAFAVDSSASYTADAGAVANFAVTAGTLKAAANLTTRSDLVQTAYQYAVGDARVTAKVGVGATLSGFLGGVVVKRPSAGAYVSVDVSDNGTSSSLRIVTNPGRVLKATTAITRLTTGTAYWVRGRTEGNVVFGELWTSAPTVTGTPAATVTYTLAGADATALGVGVAGRQGLVSTPQDAAAFFDDLTVEPYVVQSAAPNAVVVVPGVPGELPALGRLVAVDSAGQPRRHVEWGLQQRYTDLATSLRIDSGSLVTSGFAGASTTRSGSFNTNVLRASLLAQPVAVCGLGNLSHVGTFRVKARVYATSLSVLARLSWQDGDGPFRSNGWSAPPVVNNFAEIDLGTVTINEATLGTQKWSGRIDAYSTAFGDTIDVDYVFLIPVAEGYGKARASYTYQAGVVAGHDEFEGLGGGTALNTQTAAAGGTWATTGDATDLTAATAVNHTVGGTTSVARSATGDASVLGRRAILGSTAFTSVEVGAYFDLTGTATQISTYRGRVGLLARFTDINNALRVYADLTGSTKGNFSVSLKVATLIAGVDTQIAVVGGKILSAGAWYGLHVVAYASGLLIAQLLDTNGNVIVSTQVTSASLATGGALATGTVGMFDRNTGGAGTAVTRSLDDFYVATPIAEPIVVYSGRTAEVRYDGAIRQDSTGTYYGNVPAYRGSRFLPPPAGENARTSRVFAKARRNDIEAAADDQVADSTTFQVLVTPRGVTVPR